MAAVRKRKPDDPTQIILFPGPAVESVEGSDSAIVQSQPATILTKQSVPALPETEEATSIVICGSFRRDPPSLAEIHQKFLDLRCRILSPETVDIRREEDGFVYMRGEETQTPETLERRHLNAIAEADFVWLHAPEGYVGLSASLEIGYATAIGTPVFASTLPNDMALKTMVKIVDRPEDVLPFRLAIPSAVPKPAVSRFQNYYRKVAIQRGYERESAQNCLLLMVEEVGELARGLRRAEKLARHHASHSEPLQELADVFIYVVHMANILGADLGEVVREKEAANWKRFLQKLHA